MKNRPKIGIIHHPYQKQFNGQIEAKTYLGSVETGLYYSEIKDYMDEFQLYDIERSLHYLSPFQPKVLGDLNNYEIKFQGIKFWDICAGEALMLSRFGIVTDKDQWPIIYQENLEDYTFTNGMLMARSEDMYNLGYSRLKECLQSMKITRGNL